jgi:hypothetical protein
MDEGSSNDALAGRSSAGKACRHVRMFLPNIIN